MSQFDPHSGYDPAHPFHPKPIDFDFETQGTAEADIRRASYKKKSKETTKKIAHKAAQALQSTTGLDSIPLNDLSKKKGKITHQATVQSTTTFIRIFGKGVARICEILQRKFSYTFGNLSPTKKELLDVIQKALKEMPQPLTDDQIDSLKTTIIDNAGENEEKLRAIHALIREDYSMLVAHFENPEDAARLMGELCKASLNPVNGKTNLNRFTELWIPVFTQAMIPKSALDEKTLAMLKSKKGNFITHLQDHLMSHLQKEKARALFNQIVQTLKASGLEEEQAEEYLLSTLFRQAATFIKNPEDAAVARLVSTLCKASLKTTDGKIDLGKFTKLCMPTLIEILIPDSALQEKTLAMLQSTKDNFLSHLQELIINHLQTEKGKHFFKWIVQTLIASGIEEKQAKEYLLSALFMQSALFIREKQLELNRKIAGTGSEPASAESETMADVRTGDTLDALEHLKSDLTPQFLQQVLHLLAA